MLSPRSSFSRARTLRLCSLLLCFFVFPAALSAGSFPLNNSVSQDTIFWGREAGRCSSVLATPAILHDSVESFVSLACFAVECSCCVQFVHSAQIKNRSPVSTLSAVRALSHPSDLKTARKSKQVIRCMSDCLIFFIRTWKKQHVKGGNRTNRWEVTRNRSWSKQTPHPSNLLLEQESRPFLTRGPILPRSTVHDDAQFQGWLSRCL